MNHSATNINPLKTMSRDFQQHDWDRKIEWELHRLLELAVFEDVENIGDLTSRALIPETVRAVATVHSRQDGVIAGIQAVSPILAAIDSQLTWTPEMKDGAVAIKGDRVGVLEGPARSLLTAERLVLNFMGRLSGIASLTRRYVEAVDGTGAGIYDTRKTTPGWRLLEKYAVRCGGGRNHRTGLFDAVLIKDNHLAFGQEDTGHFRPADAVLKARKFFQHQKDSGCLPQPRGIDNFISATKPPSTETDPLPIIEIEVDTLQQLEEVLPSQPDIVLLDNMDANQLRLAVEIRNRLNPSIQLEASGGINLESVRAVAKSGVERISVGALTHSAVGLDLGLDWGQ